MRPTVVAALVAVLSPTLARAQAWKRPLSVAADAVEDAFDRAQRSNGRCRSTVAPMLDRLVDALDATRKQQQPAEAVHQLRFELAALAQQAPFAACPIGLTEDLQRGLDALEEARVAMWNTGRPGPGPSRRDRRNGTAPPATASPFVQLAPLRITPNFRFQNEPAVQLSVPEVRFEGLQGQGFYLATKFRSFEGDWSEWVTTQVWTVPSSPFVWANAYNHVLRYSTLAEDDFSNGRFIAHVAVFSADGRELAFRETAFRVNLPRQQLPQPPPPVVRRDCGTFEADPGCLMVRDGQFPMDAATFQGFLQSLRANRSEMMRAQTLQALVQTHFLTAAQLEPLLDLFQGEMMRLDFAARAAPRVVNPQHAIGFAVKFRSSRYQAQYTQVMAQQPPGVLWQPGMVGPGGVVLQPGVVVQPGVNLPGVVVQLPGITVTTNPSDPYVVPAVVQPGVVQPAVVQQVVGRDCGTGPNDPGCGLSRNGFTSMDVAVFSGFMRSVRAVSNELTREDMCEKVIARNGLTALQLAQVLDLFNNEITRLDIARTAATHVVDPQHALGLSTKFNNSISAEEFVEVYAGQQ